MHSRIRGASISRVRDSTTSCSDRSASAGGGARRTGCCCVRGTCASGGVRVQGWSCVWCQRPPCAHAPASAPGPVLSACSVAPAAAAPAASAPMAEHSSCCVVRFLSETLRRHPLLLAVASSRDVASSLSQTAVAAAKRCRSGLLCGALRTRQMTLECEEEGRPGESHLTFVR